MARWIYHRPIEHSNEHELAVANALASLSKRWTIRWGFYYTDNHGVRREGDFLIFDPRHGLLVLEVKGYRFRHFAPTGAWENGPTGNRDHPLIQLDEEYASVLRALTEAHPGWFPIAKALCLPREFINHEQGSYQDIPRELIVDSYDLANFESIYGRFFKGQTPHDIDRHRQTFLQVYGQGRKAENLKHFLDHNERLFRQQAARQFGLLDALENNRQLLVEGGAGTGKTWHAVNQAVRYAERGEGTKVLLLCYNIALGRLLRELVSRHRLKSGEIVVFHWEALAAHLHEVCGLGYEAPGPQASREEKIQYYERELPEWLLTCVQDVAFADRLPRFDALVVDEAQDHDTSFAGEEASPDALGCGWWAIYFALLREGRNAPITLLYDCAQRPPFRERGGFDIQRLAATLSQPAFVRLPHALRYTRLIFAFLRKLRAEGTEALLACLQEPDSLPEGPDVEIVPLSEPTPLTIRAEVERLLTEWAESGYCQPEEALILHPRTAVEKALGDCRELLGLPLVEYGSEPASSEKVIRHLSINRAKGLDARAVIVVGVSPFHSLTRPDDQYTYFMGASRARQLLAIVEV